MIKVLRALLGVPQKKLAEESGVSRRELARIEAGECHPTQETSSRIDDAFQAVIDERASSARSER